MTSPFQFTIINLQLSINDQCSMIKWSTHTSLFDAWKLLFENSMKIENCTLKITARGVV